MATRTDVCYELLKGRILDGTYGPGHRLVIDQLGREHNISTIPWRESLRRLEAEGWVEIIPNVGARVATFDEGEWARTMRLLARLEGLATALASDELTEADLADARRMNREMREALADFDPMRFTQLNRQFHTVIFHRAPDKHLIALLDTEWARLDFIRRSAFTHAPGRAVESVAEHEALLDLLEAHADADTIETAARQHKLNTLEAVTRHAEARGTALA
ncbi:GntR family transcriptional regulator [Mangrovihabitans endophyticus]|uniref:GntR family transcriptional regulator n=1 Tax=Mangrovihabitans endophyticus TaxID=1751298 RepID=A0A8J3BW85_9ACTN|nr:GntR family transcriptional regulator [Mangrovihabitans endophyticus]GGK75869.1 GntR family transcriptional regulator [Mangrovihabitans endophyticus]